MLCFARKREKASQKDAFPLFVFSPILPLESDGGKEAEIWLTVVLGLDFVRRAAPTRIEIFHIFFGGEKGRGVIDEVPFDEEDIIEVVGDTCVKYGTHSDA